MPTNLEYGPFDIIGEKEMILKEIDADRKGDVLTARRNRYPIERFSVETRASARTDLRAP